MNVRIKSFHVGMDVKNKGIEFEVCDTDAKGGGQIGDLVLSKAGLTWCKGKTTTANGIKVDWAEFIEWMESEYDR